MHYLYRITNILNGKVYIGQTIKPEYRWYQHRSYAGKENKHKQYVHRAMAKYGVENFIFEVIATCRTQDDANDTEAVLISQYNCQDIQFGYNIKPGGNNAPHSEETKQKLSEATYKQIAEKGHPAQGTKRSPEQLITLSKARQDHPIEYTPEVRQHMSDAHIGIKDSEETKQNKSKSAKEAWEKRIDYSRKCEAPGCEISGKAKYKIINGARYCNKHGLRMLRYDRLDTIR